MASRGRAIVNIHTVLPRIFYLAYKSNLLIRPKDLLISAGTDNLACGFMQVSAVIQRGAPQTTQGLSRGIVAKTSPTPMCIRAHLLFKSKHYTWEIPQDLLSLKVQGYSPQD